MKLKTIKRHLHLETKKKFLFDNSWVKRELETKITEFLKSYDNEKSIKQEHITSIIRSNVQKKIHSPKHIYQVQILNENK